MLPSRQRFTRPVTLTATDSALSTGLVVASVRRKRSGIAELDHGECLFHSLAETGRRSRIKALQPGGRRLQGFQRPLVAGLAVGGRQLRAELLMVLLGQVGFYVAGVVDLAALDHSPLSIATEFRQRLIR